MAKKGSTKSPKKNKTVTTTTEVTVIPEERLPNGEVEILTPQQSLFLKYYYDTGSPTRGDAKNSAIAAGFSEEYSSTITYKRPKWWSVLVGQENSVKDLIEQHIVETLTLPSVTQAMGAFGPVFNKEKVKEQVGTFKNGKPKFKVKTVKTPVFVPNIQVIKAKTEVSKLAAPAHDPDRYGKKAGNNNKFVFNMALVRERYKT